MHALSLLTSVDSYVYVSSVYEYLMCSLTDTETLYTQETFLNINLNYLNSA